MLGLGIRVRSVVFFCNVIELNYGNVVDFIIHLLQRCVAPFKGLFNVQI